MKRINISSIYLILVSKIFIYISFLFIVSIILSSKGVKSEEIVSFQGDMPKYIMNGVFFYDLIREFQFTNIIEYTYQYYAKYPALSLGHHAIFLGILEIPFYHLFGVSVFSAKLTIIFCISFSAITWFILIKSIHDENIAFFSTLLFITTPFIVKYSRVVLSEIPALAMIIITIYLFHCYCRKETLKYAILFIIILFFSIITRYTSIYMIPIFLCYFVVSKGPRIILKKRVIISIIITVILLFPLTVFMVKLSQTNFNWVTQKSLSSRLDMSNILYYPSVIWRYHLTLYLLMMSLPSICVSIYRKDKRSILFLLWIVGFYLQITFTGAQEPRYAIYWIPAFCQFAATTIDFFHHRLWKIFASSILIILAGYQFAIAFQQSSEYADGYEKAAKYIIENKKGESVLFSGSVDTGYFIFFTRKHNPNKELIVLRADKLMATSQLDRIVEDRVTTRAQIYQILQDFGVSYVVVENKEFASRPLQWLREELQSDKFMFHKTIPIRSNSRKLQDATLTIYEYKDYTPPKRGKILHMNIPLMGGSIAVPFDDLLRN